jgi:hypothetical protein
MYSIPDRTIVRLRYIEVMNIDMARLPYITNGAIYMSSLHKPRYDTTDPPAHQPMWYDQWTPNIFRRFRVSGIKYSITSQNAELNLAYYIAARPQGTPVSETNVTALLEDKSTNWKMAGSISASPGVNHLRGYMDVAKTLGVSKTAIREDEYYCADYDSDPIRMGFLNVYMWSCTSGEGTVNMNLNVVLTYYATLFGRNTPNTS